MVEFSPDIRPDVFVRRSGLKTGTTLDLLRSDQTGNGLGSWRGDTVFRGGPFSGSSAVELSEGARQALYGSERALELARDFNAARLGRPARRRLGEFFQGFARDFGAVARDIDKTARRIERLTEDLDRRFGDLADRVFARLDSGSSGGFRTTEVSLSEVRFSLQVENTLLTVVKDGEASLLRLDQVQLSLEAVRVETGVSVRDRVGVSPKTPLIELPKGLTASQIVDRLIATFGSSSVSASVEKQEIQIALSSTVFTATAAGGDVDGKQNSAGEDEPEGGVDVVA